MRILLTLVIVSSLLVNGVVIAQVFAPLGPGVSGVPLGPNGGSGGGGGPPPPVACSPVNGLDYTKTCDTIYHMGIFQ
jgi:hypothetical protein